MSDGGMPPLIVQRDRTVLLDLHADGAEETRVGLGRFAELVKSPEHLHTYRLTAISIWNAVYGGMTAEEMVAFLAEHSVTGVPREVKAYLHEMVDRTGRIAIVRGEDGGLWLRLHEDVREQVLGLDSVQQLLEVREDGIRLVDGMRGQIKKALVRVGFPVDDLAGYEEGDALTFHLDSEDGKGRPFSLRHYQEAAARAFWADGSPRGGAGVVVLPCGAGKTLVGIRSMELYQTQTLILTTNRTSVSQWRRELLERTSLREDQVGEYTSESKEIKPVTISTYQILTWRDRDTGEFPHYDTFGQANWGLVVYDEVHLLPAPVFRVTAELQARRRLGLTATLVREDGREDEVFSLIGPCRYELPWRDLEQEGHIATARCVEVRVPLDPELEERYADSDRRSRIRIAAENPAKLPVVDRLLEQHQGERVLVIGQYMRQLDRLSLRLEVPLITGKTPNAEREELYAAFREGRITTLIVSKVANFAIDLPDASVAIQVSGTFGSRQEEAQRLGRVLRKKEDGGGATFYTVVTEGTREQEFSARRQLFLAEQGYAYEIIAGGNIGCAAPQTGDGAR